MGLLHGLVTPWVAVPAADRLDPAATRHRQLIEASAVIGWPEPVRLTHAVATGDVHARAARAALIADEAAADDGASADADAQ